MHDSKSPVAAVAPVYQLMGSCAFCPQAARQNVHGWAAPDLQLWILHQDWAIQPFFWHWCHQPPQSKWFFRCQWRLWHHYRGPPQWPGLTAHVQQCRDWWRGLPQAIWWLRQCHHGRLTHQVRVYAQCHPQEAVSSVWGHCIWISLWSGLLWSMQSLLQANNSRYGAWESNENEVTNIFFGFQAEILLLFNLKGYWNKILSPKCSYWIVEGQLQQKLNRSLVTHKRLTFIPA